MNNIKLALYKMLPTGVLVLLRTVILHLTGNANFSRPRVDLADMTRVADALEAAITNAVNGDRESRILRDNLVLEAKDMLKLQANYIRSEAGDDLAKLASSGYPLVKQREPVDKVGIPSNPIASTGKATGQVEFRWKSVHGAHAYQMWKAVVNEQGQLVWTSLGVTTRSRNTITDLDSHQLYAFRVNAIGVNGPGLQSAITEAVAA